MTDKDKNLKVFLKENTQAELKKPINEFSEILGKIENKPTRLFNIPKWLYATAGAIAVSMFVVYISPPNINGTNDEQLMAFLESSLDGASIYEDESDESNTLLSLVN